jgi:hypothetical protein
MPGEDASEHRVQSALVATLRHRLRANVVCMAIPNGGARHPIIGRQLKAEGLLPGSPDLVFALERAKVFWLEMKKANERNHRDGGLSDEQVGLHYKMKKNGHDIRIAYSVDEALELLEERGLLR